MYCKKCGSGLPSKGYICKTCGTMMDSDQIKIQKEMLKEREKERKEITLMSDKYSSMPINREYKKAKENKYLGAVLIIMTLLVLIVIAVLKVM